MSEILKRQVADTFEALAEFDVVRLEELKQSIGEVTAGQLTLAVAQRNELLPELISKQFMLGQLLQGTSANLKVLASVLQATASNIPRSGR